jgi:hypothetical protein
VILFLWALFVEMTAEIRNNIHVTEISKFVINQILFLIKLTLLELKNLLSLSSLISSYFFQFMFTKRRRMPTYVSQYRPSLKEYPEEAAVFKLWEVFS